MHIQMKIKYKSAQSVFSGERTTEINIKYTNITTDGVQVSQLWSHSLDNINVIEKVISAF